MVESWNSGFGLDAGLYEPLITINQIQYGNPGLNILIWESWSTGKLIWHVALVHINPLLYLKRFNTKSVESWIPGIEMDSGLYEPLIRYN